MEKIRIEYFRGAALVRCSGDGQTEEVQRSRVNISVERL